MKVNHCVILNHIYTNLFDFNYLMTMDPFKGSANDGWMNKKQQNKKLIEFFSTMIFRISFPNILKGSKTCCTDG